MLVRARAQKVLAETEVDDEDSSLIRRLEAGEKVAVKCQYNTVVRVGRTADDEPGLDVPVYVSGVVQCFDCLHALRGAGVRRGDGQAVGIVRALASQRRQVFPQPLHGHVGKATP